MIVQVLRWVRGHKSSVAGLVLVVLGCCALLSLSRRVQHWSARHAAAAAVAAASTVPDASAGVPPVAPARAAAPATALGTEFGTAARYVDFIQEAMGRPEDGGRFYALLAWKRCAAVHSHSNGATPGAGEGAVRDGALARVQDLARRCAGVLEAWPGADALHAAAQLRGGRDGLLPEGGRGIVTPARRETADADVDAALHSGDRRVAAEVLRGNAGVLDVGNSTGDPAVDRQLREAAGEIVACELADDCRRGDAVSLHCVDSGDCAHDDWRDVVLAQVPEAQRIIFDTMLAALRARAGLAPGP